MLQIAADTATIFAAVFVCITVWLAYEQVKEMRSANLLQAVNAILEATDAPVFKSNCRFVYREFPLDPEKITREQLDKAENVWLILNRIGTMVQERIMPERLGLLLFSDVAIRAWDRLSSRIELERELRNDPLFMKPFQYLAKKSREYRERQFPGQKLTTFTHP